MNFIRQIIIKVTERLNTCRFGAHKVSLPSRALRIPHVTTWPVCPEPWSLRSSSKVLTSGGGVLNPTSFDKSIIINFVTTFWSVASILPHSVEETPRWTHSDTVFIEFRASPFGPFHGRLVSSLVAVLHTDRIWGKFSPTVLDFPKITFLCVMQWQFLTTPPPNCHKIPLPHGRGQCIKRWLVHTTHYDQH